MANSNELPVVLRSSKFGELHLNESQVDVGTESICHCTFETRTASDDGKPNVVLNPDFDRRYPENAIPMLHALLADAESRHAHLERLGTAGVFELQRNNICELGDRTCYDRWGATQAMLLSDWKLESVVNFVDGIRLIYSGHPVYYLDLLLEFDSSWTATQAQFDG